eukprot:SAG11_NODE_610_length_8221_cov_4.801650_7_plen_180_part_00
MEGRAALEAWCQVEYGAGGRGGSWVVKDAGANGAAVRRLEAPPPDCAIAIEPRTTLVATGDLGNRSSELGFRCVGCGYQGASSSASLRRSTAALEKSKGSFGALLAAAADDDDADAAADAPLPLLLPWLLRLSETFVLSGAPTLLRAAIRRRARVPLPPRTASRREPTLHTSESQRELL